MEFSRREIRKLKDLKNELEEYANDGAEITCGNPETMELLAAAIQYAIDRHEEIEEEL